MEKHLIPAENNFNSTEMLGYQSNMTMAEEALCHLLIILEELLLSGPSPELILRLVAIASSKLPFKMHLIRNLVPHKIRHFPFSAQKVHHCLLATRKS